MTAGRDIRSPPRGQRGQGFNKSQNSPRALPLNALDHFPPLGTQPTKAKTPPPNYSQQQQSTTAKPQQRTQYQPLPIDTRNTNPHHARGEVHGRRNFRGDYNQRQLRRDIGPEVCQYLSELSKKVIAEAAPPESEILVKRALLERLEAISKTIVPDAKLIAFGSLVTGFATANSDLDVIFTGGDRVDILNESSDDPSSNFRIPMLLESKLQEEGFGTTLLTKTRVPILKLVQKATEQSPYELQCDIGFSNHLALYNTQMLLTYSKCDPRVKEMMIFIKWWAKRRHINNPYRGTLSSYGYALIVLHYLINVVKPPVLPNLQTFPVPDSAPTNEIIFEGDSDDTFEIWFYKDIEKLPKSDNAMDIGELLKGFFEYYAHNFQWGREVVSIRTKGGLMTKQEKGWVAAVIKPGRTENSEVKNRYLFAVEDPFETEHNVSRTCNGPGVNRIKDEFKRAVWLIRVRDGGKTLFQNLCMEAPPERVWVRREDRDRRGIEEAGGHGSKDHQGAEGEAGDGVKHESVVLSEDGRNALESLV
ncbi:PAP/OAS1 substrate-binding domain-containing protein [Morchella conica CCBAS932]|uniref:polynucleotide adenylyltransferase n=2 Tax=Morchella sect. Distantes TaxID=1051054 RepID=A0A3N4L428_9PEZI|nr:PAP/OAS1 substrate-binding domain-containing protein [Morchella conica CCBAS932]